MQASFLQEHSQQEALEQGYVDGTMMYNQILSMHGSPDSPYASSNELFKGEVMLEFKVVFNVASGHSPIVHC